MKRSGPRGTLGRPGFTMIEMLTVIAIIAILAGILFPVFATVRRNVHKATCTSQLHDIAVALKLYKDDHNGVYPEALYGFLDADSGKEVNYLYPQYIKEKQIFRCPLAPYNLNETGLTDPNNTFHPTTGRPFRQYEARQRYPNRRYNVWNSVDGQFEPPKSTQYVVKYLRHWSNQRPGFSDVPRQLLYKNPPEDTVVTWCTYHRDWNLNSNPPEPKTGSIDLVLFLGGYVRPTPSDKMWPSTQVQPNHGYLVGQTD
jgi:prepilin-type N-terminal cleavage/methylation domain-containing protein